MMMTSKDVSAMSYSLFATRMLSSSLRGALATKQASLPASHWIASRSLSSGAHSRDPLARNDGMGHSTSHHHHHGIFDQHLEGADQLGPERAVDRAMIAGQGHAHHMRDLDLAAAHHGPFLAGTDRKDGGVRRVDPGGEMIDPVHAEIGDRSGAAQILLRLELAGPRPRRKILHLARDRRQRLG